ncbi:EFMT4 methyltransferase, partial [Polypterus senegalus]
MPLKHLRLTGDDFSSGHFDVYECLNSQKLDVKLSMKPVVYLQRLTDAECLFNTSPTNIVVIETNHETETNYDSSNPSCCGNSTLSFDLYCSGFTNITNIDYSSVCISNMAAKHPNCRGLEWYQMDARKLSFSDSCFDVVLEKGTLDAMLADERDPWNMSPETAKTLQCILKEVSRVLCPGGRFVSITFSQPHFRKRHYARRELDWSIQHYSYGSGFHYFMYVMTKGEPLSPQDSELEDKLLKVTCPSLTPCLEGSDSEDYLNKIEL